MKKISIIVPNYNGYNFLKNCLISLKKQTFSDFELILIDNGSQDRSIELTKTIFPETIIFKFKKNCGFSRAVNQGISLARGKYIFLLNNDTELDINCLQTMNDFLDKIPEPACVASKMLYLNKPEIINNAGDAFSIYGIAYKRGEGEKDRGQYDTPKMVFGACAGGALYHRDLLEKVGKFDESFFAYLEDVDFSFRAQSLGYKCYYLPQAIIYHVDGGTSRKKPGLSYYLVTRNSLYLIYKNFPLHWLIILSPFLLIGQIRNLLGALRHKNFTTLLKVYLDFIKNIPQLHHQRRNIQKNRQVSYHYLFSIISKKYPFPIKKHLYGLFSNHR